jgi:hypothetical protein
MPSLSKKFNRCVKSVRRTVKTRKGSNKESAAIAICTTTVLHPRKRTLKSYRRGRLVTQKKLRGGELKQQADEPSLPTSPPPTSEEELKKKRAQIDAEIEKVRSNVIRIIDAIESQIKDGGGDMTKFHPIVITSRVPIPTEDFNKAMNYMINKLGDQHSSKPTNLKTMAQAFGRTLTGKSPVTENLLKFLSELKTDKRANIYSEGNSYSVYINKLRGLVTPD